MKRDANKHADEVTDVVENSSSEIALDDLKPNVDVKAGFGPKATDVTLKRGIIN